MLIGWREDGLSSFVGRLTNSSTPQVTAYWFTDITLLVLGIEPIVCLLGTPSHTNLSFVDSLNPLTGDSNLLHILHLLVGMRGLTIVKMSCYLLPPLWSGVLEHL